MMTHHFAMTSSLLIKILQIDKFGHFSCDVGYHSRTDVIRDVISLIINHCDLQATEGSLRRTQSVRQPRSASKRSALVYSISISIYLCNELIEETAGHRKLIFGMRESFGYGSSKF